MSSFKKPDRLTDEEEQLTKSCFADIFLFPKCEDGDPFMDLAKVLSSDRKRAKEVYWMFIHRYKNNGKFFKEYHNHCRVSMALASQIKAMKFGSGALVSLYEIMKEAEEIVEKRYNKR